MTNQEAIKILSSLLSVRDMFLIYPDETFYDAIECAVAALAGGPLKVEITEIHQFAKPEDTEGLKFGD